MRICLLGECRGRLDEGMRNTTRVLSSSLSENHDVLLLDLRDLFCKSFWDRIHDFKPDIIHYLHGPTIKSFIIAKVINLYCHDSKSVMSAMRPILPLFVRELVRFAKPDLLLTQSYKSEYMFRNLGIKTQFLPCGVDIHRFSPVSDDMKRKLRRKYGIDNNKFVILHIGSIKDGRNVKTMTRLKNEDNLILIIGSSSTGVDPKIKQALQEAGCILRVEYIPNIEEIYALSDCYIYPTLENSDFLERASADSIEMPLTVLEAMSCNLPVIATPFGALPRALKEGNGLYYANNDCFIDQLMVLKNTRPMIKTREKILPYSWENVVCDLERLYLECCVD